jgi:hypothetical protein
VTNDPKVHKTMGEHLAGETSTDDETKKSSPGYTNCHSVSCMPQAADMNDPVTKVG